MGQANKLYHHKNNMGKAVKQCSQENHSLVLEEKSQSYKTGSILVSGSGQVVPRGK